MKKRSLFDFLNLSGSQKTENSSTQEDSDLFQAAPGVQTSKRKCPSYNNSNDVGSESDISSQNERVSSSSPPCTLSENDPVSASPLDSESRKTQKDSSTPASTRLAITKNAFVKCPSSSRVESSSNKNQVVTECISPSSDSPSYDITKPVGNKEPSGQVLSADLDPPNASQSTIVYGNNVLSSSNFVSDTDLSSMYDNEDFTHLSENQNVASSKEKRFPFLADVRDKNGIRPNEPGYDPSSLYISPECFAKLSPFEKQFWSIKSRYFDTVILFKKGKFYELYESDAELVARLFDFRITDRVNMKMSGFPEKSYPQWASKLISLGYKVGRVEQAENAIGKRLREREEKGSSSNRAAKNSSDKLVRRELVEIVTAGTIYDPEYLSMTPEPVYVASLVITSCPGTFTSSSSSAYSFSLVLYDASINRLFYREFVESRELDKMRTVLVERNIKEMIVSRSDRQVLRPLNFLLKQIQLIEPDKSHSEIFGASNSNGYDGGALFKRLDSEAGKDERGCISNDMYRAFEHMQGYMASLCRADALESVDICLLAERECMSIGASTLASLDVLSNNYDGTEKNSLFSAINHCITPMGVRMLRRWLLGPLTDIDKIRERREEASYFEENLADQDLQLFSEKLVSVGDLERRYGRLNNHNPTIKDLLALLKSVERACEFLKFFQSYVAAKDSSNTHSNIFGQGNGSSKSAMGGAAFCTSPVDTVPEGDWKQSDRNKASSTPHIPKCSSDRPLDFSEKVTQSYSPVENIQRLVVSATATVSDLNEFLASFFGAYRVDVEKDEIVPSDTNAEKKKLDEEEQRINTSLRDYIESLRQNLQISELSYKSVNKEHYMIEAPTEVTMPHEFTLCSMTKSHRRYYSPYLKSLVQSKEELEEKLFHVRGNALRHSVGYVKQFKEMISRAAELVAKIDCYVSFAKFATENETCCPEFYCSFLSPSSSSVTTDSSGDGMAVDNEASSCCERPEGKKEMTVLAVGNSRTLDSSRGEAGERLRITGLISPIYRRHIRNDFLPQEKITLVTGPNMGGKSTFLRAVALNIILAQIGMRVTASSMRVPVFDCIFTRVGASDSLARGESTFMAEMLETSLILNQATERSFVIMDELGRGTSTEDGTAIARAVLEHLRKIGCYTLFSTHYHKLVVKMECVDKAYVDVIAEDGEVVFLHKVRRGVCLDSHGIEVARLAGIPEQIVVAAAEVKRRLLEQHPFERPFLMQNKVNVVALAMSLRLPETVQSCTFEVHGQVFSIDSENWPVFYGLQGAEEEKSNNSGSTSNSSSKNGFLECKIVDANHMILVGRCPCSLDDTETVDFSLSDVRIIGHRGVGSSKHQPAVRENTIESFTAAHVMGADMIELDVHATTDDILVVHHDMVIGDCASDVVQSLTYSQYKGIAERNGAAVTTLNEVLDRVPQELGINVEIKSIMTEHILRDVEDGKHSEDQKDLPPPSTMSILQRVSGAVEYVARVVRCILTAVKKHPRRKILFSSFDPFICLVLKATAPAYKVCLLLSCDTYRTLGGERAVERILQRTPLDGLVLDTELFFKERSSFIRLKQKQNKVLLCYGEGTNEAESAATLFNDGVTGLITDKIQLFGHITSQKPCE